MPEDPTHEQDPAQTSEDAEPETFVLDDADTPPNLKELEQLAHGSPGAAASDEVTDLQEQLLRAKADYANYLRVAERNVSNAREQTTMSLLRSLIPVLDHFDLTLQVDPDTINPTDLLQGVKMVEDELIKALSSYGVRKLTAEPGDTFDPNLHTAILRQPHDEIESGHIVQVMQPGYAVNDKTIRPVQVAVAE